ncbi:hypothetical protein HYFRA_00008792 [Hymenoscyphus fraxineus]|uniref:Glucose receptor Git3 N-terminal domain-containing protein n=1 Tax=Hymenoscyphus fraxineus TaxID=746836 RepID=A0A9N9PJK4_9HELO|nr:hypothetical protein HYFRA_00008792 [Hymenoscyphus fraxineus]
MLDLAVAIPTLVGSALSMTAAGFVFLCYLLLPSQLHFRHILIINLAAADFLNAANNTVSGIYAMIHRAIPPGVGCNVNGLIGQLTVQGTDFSILAIAIATVITIKRSNFKPSMSSKRKLFITFGIWTVPLTTSLTGLFLDDYRPVTGNWCWLDAKKPALRYALGHGWRIAIIFTVASLYAYLFFYIQRHFSMMDKVLSASRSNNCEVTEEVQIYEDFVIDEAVGDGEAADYFSQPGSPEERSSRNLDEKIGPLSPCREISQKLHPSRTMIDRPMFETFDPLALVRRPLLAPPFMSTITTTCTAPPTLQQRKRRIQRLLLVNAYPIAYILLWIPGLLNRVFESVGYSARWIRILQASTQFVGFANAIVYGYNERIVARAMLWWSGKGQPT